MRILVDARVFAGVGIARYLRALTSRWLLDPRVEAIRFLGDPERLGGWLSGVDPRGISSVARWTDPPFSLRAQVRWAAALWRRSRDVDVTFFPYHDVPLVRHPAPSVVTVHDLTPFLVPGFPIWKRAAGSLLVDGALRNADRVVTVSAGTRRDIVERAPDVASRVVVIPNGVDRIFRPLSSTEAETAEKRWGRLRPFLLAIGSARPHKNLELTVELLGRLRADRPDLRLVLVGPHDRRLDRVLRRAGALGVGDAVEVTGFLEDEALREVYATAALFLFPSLHEGFGLPPLEAMACGTPVLASDRGPLPDVLGRAAVLLDPRDARRWETEARRILDDEEHRAGLVEAGLRKAAEYSWDRSAAATLDVLQGVAGAAPAPSRGRR